MKSNDFVEFHHINNNKSISIRKDMVVAFYGTDKGHTCILLDGNAGYYDVRESYEEVQRKLFDTEMKNPTITMKYDENMKEYIDEWIKKWSTQGITPLTDDEWHCAIAGFLDN